MSFSGAISKALIAFSMATYCYSLPTNVEIKDETDVRKYAIRLSFAYLDSIFKVMDDAIFAKDNNSNVTFQDGVAIFTNTDPKNYTTANKNAVLLYSWFYMNIYNGKTSIDDIVEKVKVNNKYQDIDFSKSITDIKGYDEALKLSEWVKKLIANNLTMNKLCSTKLDRRTFYDNTKIKITGGDDNEDGYRLLTYGLEKIQGFELMLQLKGKVGISNIKILQSSYLLEDNKEKVYDGFSVYTASLTEYMKIEKHEKDPYHIYGIKGIEDHPLIQPVYDYKTHPDGSKCAHLRRIIINENIPHDNIEIEIYPHVIKQDDKTKYEVVLDNEFCLHKAKGSDINVKLTIKDRFGERIVANPGIFKNFSINSFSDIENSDEHAILKEIDFYGLDTLKVNSLSGLLKNNKQLETVKNIRRITKNIYDFSQMYYGCERLKNYTPLPKLLGITSKKIDKCLNIEEMFHGCPIKEAVLTGIKFTNFTDVYTQGLFEGCKALKTVDISYTTTSDIGIFTQAFNKKDMPSLETINVYDMKIKGLRQNSNSTSWQKFKEWAEENGIKLISYY